MALALCLTTSACCHLPNSDLRLPAYAALASTRDPGVLGGGDQQPIQDESRQTFEAVYSSTHPGATEDGVQTTSWVYVRGIELPLSSLASAGRLSPEVRRFFTQCPAALPSPQTGADLVRSGIDESRGVGRLVLTRLEWDTRVGPGPNRFETARIENARLTVFGSGIPVTRARELTLDLSLQFLPAAGDMPRMPVFRRTVSGLRTDAVTVDCASRTLAAPEIPLGSSGWFHRQGVFNLAVSVTER